MKTKSGTYFRMFSGSFARLFGKFREGKVSRVAFQMPKVAFLSHICAVAKDDREQQCNFSIDIGNICDIIFLVNRTPVPLMGSTITLWNERVNYFLERMWTFLRIMNSESEAEFLFPGISAIFGYNLKKNNTGGTYEEG